MSLFLFYFFSGDIRQLVKKKTIKTCFIFQNIRLPKYLDPESLRKKGDTVL